MAICRISPATCERSSAHLAPPLKRFAFGEDDRPLELSNEVKSISSENTFLQDTEDRKMLRRTLREQAQEIAAELQQKGLAAKTVEVRVRYGDFTTLNRQLTFEDPTADAHDLPVRLPVAGPPSTGHTSLATDRPGRQQPCPSRPAVAAAVRPVRAFGMARWNGPQQVCRAELASSLARGLNSIRQLCRVRPMKFVRLALVIVLLLLPGTACAHNPACARDNPN